MANFPCDARVGVGDGALGRLDVFAVVFERVVQTSVASPLLGRDVEPGLCDFDTCSCALVLQSEMLDQRDKGVGLGGGKGSGGGVAGHEVVKGRECDGAFGLVQEDDGDE